MKRALVVSILAALATTTSVQAMAQPSDHERALRHFEAGRAHVKAGRCDLAIDELVSSIDFEPTSVGARLNLGDCYVTLGRLPEAFRWYKEAETMAQRTRDARVDEARRAAAAVEAKLVRVIVREPQPRIAGTTLAVDGGQHLAPPWIIAVAPDEPHTLEANTPDGRRWETRFRAPAGQVVRFELGFDERRVERSEDAHRTVAPTGASTMKTAGVLVGATGAATMIAGGVFAVLAAVFRSDLADAVTRDPRCTGGYPDGTCHPDARASIDPIERRAFVSSTVATVGLTVGTALLAGGIALYAFAPSPAPSPSPTRISIRVGGGAFVEGSF